MVPYLNPWRQRESEKGLGKEEDSSGRQPKALFSTPSSGEGGAASGVQLCCEWAVMGQGEGGQLVLKALGPRSPGGFGERKFGCFKSTGSEWSSQRACGSSPPEALQAPPSLSRTKPISFLPHLLHLLFPLPFSLALEVTLPSILFPVVPILFPHSFR